MKRLVHGFIVLSLFLNLAVSNAPVWAQGTEPPTPTPAPATAPTPGLGSDIWQFDAKVTEVGKRAERSRQFISWVLSHKSIQNHAIFRELWLVSLQVTLVLTTVVVAIMGIGLMIARKKDISIKVDVVPILTQVGLVLLYAVFSYVIVLGIIQITELMSSFFITYLGGDKLFAIFFSADPSGDTGYRTLVGQRLADPLANESVKTSLFLIDATSYTYFVMGIMILIRQIVLWFLLVLAPFLALLMPFRFIRNIGWIWIGVFFQWAFYGPLFGLFLWALTKIWQVGIPFAFNFGRIEDPNGSGVVYPLAINILYGGPQQVLSGLGQPLSHVSPINSSNYVDTFAEYVISLLMLWVVMILPWWLLRIFRDYCCEGLMAMKNILMNMMGQGRLPGEPPPPGGLSSSLGQQTGQQMQMNKQVYEHHEMKQKEIISRHEDIKVVKTEEISRRMDVQVNRLTDIARLETHKDTRERASSSLQYLKNPLSAENRTQQSEFTKIKTELTTRAATGDVAAKRLLDATTSSGMMVRDKIQLLAHEQASVAPITQKISVEFNIPEEKVKQIATTFAQTISREEKILEEVSTTTKTEKQKTRQVIEAAPRAAAQRTQDQALTQLSRETNLEKENTRQILQEVVKKTENEEVAKKVAEKEKTTVEEAKKVGNKVFKDAATEPEKPATKPKQEVSIEEYEEMRRMWVEHYTKGEVPVSDKIKDRASWVKEEAVRLDNVLNKIASENEEVRAQGLTEVADIIPFFILGDMSIQDIAIYLKAKLTAAKEVQLTLGQEAVVKERLEKAQVEFVEVDRSKDTAKAEVLKQELPTTPVSDKAKPPQP